jgi:S1-C subfamily serine protease
MNNPLLSVSEQLAATVRQHSAAVAAVQGGRRFPSSGIIWRPGVIVTTEHAIRREDEITVTIQGEQTAAARLVGRDPGTDIAVLQFDAAGAAQPIERGAGAEPAPGALVLAIGRSPHAGPQASMGIISAVGPSWRTWRGGRIDRYIRLDVGMYPGSSGSAVVDAGGNLVGVATSALSRIAGVAVPASTVDRTVDELLAKGRISRGFLGVALQPVRVPQHQMGAEEGAGLIIMTVEPDGPAARAGVLVGDILLTVNGQPVRDTDDVQNALETCPPGTEVKAALLRGGQREESVITVGERPAREA